MDVQSYDQNDKNEYEVNAGFLVLHHLVKGLVLTEAVADREILSEPFTYSVHHPLQLPCLTALLHTDLHGRNLLSGVLQ